MSSSESLAWSPNAKAGPPLAAAQAAAEEQELPGYRETIEYEDDKGKWHTETAGGRDRPHAVVKDKD